MKNLKSTAVAEKGKRENVDETNLFDFDQLFESYHKKIYFFCIHYGLKSEDAEEVVQEAFIRVWQSRNNFQPGKNIRSYIYTIAKNVIVDEFRRRVKRKAAEAYQMHLLPAGNQTENELDFKETNEIIGKVLHGLPVMRKLIFELSRYKGLSNKEISRELGISVKTVETHITLALNSFREVFKDSEILSILLILSLS